MKKDTGASLRDRATRPADQAPSGLGDTASVPSAVADFLRIVGNIHECAPDGSVDRITVGALRRAAETMRALNKALEDSTGALQFILAFYEPGQRYLDTEAWKSACARGVSAYLNGAAAIGWTPTWKRAVNGEVSR